MRIRIGLTVCGIAALAMGGVAGCGSGGSSSAAGGTSTAGGASTAGGTSTATAAAPSWAAALGSGVTVTGPGGVSAGDGSPGGVLLTGVNDLESGQYAKICDVVQPSAQSQCESDLSSVAPSAIASLMPTFKNYEISYTAIQGDEALVGATGTICAPDQTPSCETNSDPAAIFDSGKSFAALWTAATNASSNAYGLSQEIKVNGTWYGYSPSGF